LKRITALFQPGERGVFYGIKKSSKNDMARKSLAVAAPVVRMLAMIHFWAVSRQKLKSKVQNSSTTKNPPLLGYSLSLRRMSIAAWFSVTILSFCGGAYKKK
jgi:hypothetical protein